MSPRRRQGAVLVVGGAFLYLVAEIGSLEFFWTPLLVGLAYLAAAAAGGKQGSYWATALVIGAWGIGVVLLGERVIESVSPEAAYLLFAGAGALLAAALERAGFAIDALGIAASVFLAGLIYALEPRIDALSSAATYAAAIAVVGLVRLFSPERKR